MCVCVCVRACVRTCVRVCVSVFGGGGCCCWPDFGNMTTPELCIVTQDEIMTGQVKVVNLYKSALLLGPGDGMRSVFVIYMLAVCPATCLFLAP